MRCGICKNEGHNRRTCPEKSHEKSGGSDAESITTTVKIHQPEVKLIKNSTRTYSTSAASTKTTQEQVKQVIKTAKDIQKDVLEFKDTLNKARQVQNFRKSEELKEKCAGSSKKSQTDTTTVSIPSVSQPKAKATPTAKNKKPGIHWLNSDALKRLNEGTYFRCDYALF